MQVQEMRLILDAAQRSPQLRRTLRLITWDNVEMKTLKLVCTGFAVFLTASSALAGGIETPAKPFVPVDAQTMIDACWEATYEMRLGSTVDTREGIFLSVRCLEERILDQVDVLLPASVLSREIAAAKLEAIRGAYSDLYWSIYNENKGCRICPTQYYSSDLSALSDVLEEMLRDSVEQRNRYKL